ncbi:MAG: zinc-dependent alcohol dehydrogenase family protein [Actinobacteria bacterium]|jgi:D-arabinitol dehydrogenase (NADP+)|nr:zinc-dependent alcohol dehydrogenase family protein [Actinomycetota bacterium]
MKAIQYDGPESWALVDLPMPEPGPSDVLIKVLRAGICGTDRHLHVGEFGPTYPLTPGHEFAGEVVSTGNGVESIRVGQRVVADNCVQCGECEFCRRHMANFCEHTVAQGVNAQGGFAEYIVVREGRCFVVDDLDLDTAVLAEPTACVVHGLDQLAVEPGSRVLSFGAGPTGLILAQLLARHGACDLTVAAPTAFKLEHARAAGAQHTVQVDKADLAATKRQLEEICPGGFDVVIDATGAVSVLDEAIGLTRSGGTIFVYGMTEENATWTIPPYEIFRRELTIKGSFAQVYSFDRALLMLRNGQVDPAGLITHRFSLEEYGAALEMSGRSECIKAVIHPHG